MRRLLSYIMFLVLLSGTIAAWSWNRSEREMLDDQVDGARQATQRLERAIRIQAATGKAPMNGRGWPETVDPAWFGEDPPLNPFIPVGRPWVEVASEDEDQLTDPPIRQSVTRDLAMFWYNPANGIVRARVGPMISDQRAVDVYNRINGSSVPSLFDARARLRDAPMLSPAQERLLAGASSSKKPPLVVVRRLERPVDTEIVPGSESAQPGAEGSEQSEPQTPLKQASAPTEDAQESAAAPADARRTEHPEEQSDE
jgi:hypothetical protein